MVSDPFDLFGPRGIVLRLHVQPGARRSTVTGMFGDALKVKVAAPPSEGRANAAVVDLVAELLGVRSSQVELASGHASRSKRLKVTDIDVDDVRSRITAALAAAAR